MVVFVRLMLRNHFLNRDALVFGFTFSFNTLDVFVVGEVLDVLWMRVRLVRLGLGCRVELF